MLTKNLVTFDKPLWKGIEYDKKPKEECEQLYLEE